MPPPHGSRSGSRIARGWDIFGRRAACGTFTGGIQDAKACSAHVRERCASPHHELRGRRRRGLARFGGDVAARARRRHGSHPRVVICLCSEGSQPQGWPWSRIGRHEGWVLPPVGKQGGTNVVGGRRLAGCGMLEGEGSQDIVLGSDTSSMGETSTGKDGCSVGFCKVAGSRADAWLAGTGIGALAGPAGVIAMCSVQ